MKKVILSAVSILALSACSMHAVKDVRNMEEPEPKNTYTSYQSHFYKEKALYEADQMYDWSDASLYAKKAQQAAHGDIVSPSTVFDRDIKDPMKQYAIEQRRRMVLLQWSGSSWKMPKETAEMQVNYDCWIEELEEGHQKEQIEACWKKFDELATKIEKRMMPIQGIVLFENDSYSLKDESKEILSRMAKETILNQRNLVLLDARASQPGKFEYNKDLSQKRADSVKDYLIKEGIPQEWIYTSAYGEDMPFKMPDGHIPEKENRSVLLKLH